MFDQYVDGFRDVAEHTYTLRLTAYSPNGTTPDADGYEVQDYIDEGWTPGKVQGGSQSGKDTPTRYVSVGGVERPVIQGGLHIPLDRFIFDHSLLIVAGEQRGLGWEFEVTETGRYDDPGLLGRRYLVVEVPSKSFATARRLSVVELS